MRTRRREDFPDAKDMIRYLSIAVIVVAALWFAWWRFSMAFLPSVRKEGVFVFVLAGVAAPLAIGVVQSLVIYKAARWLWAPIEAREMLRKNLCPHCRFSLAAIVPDPDGCTVCPECGAAWKLPPPPPNNPA